jgi:hypothetical protein
VRQIHPGAIVHFYKCDEWWHFTSMDADQVGDIRARQSVMPPEEPEETVAEPCYTWYEQES